MLYALAEAPASLVNSYVQSVLAISQASLQTELAPLDKDPDFIYYGALFGWGGARFPAAVPADVYDRSQR